MIKRAPEAMPKRALGLHHGDVEIIIPSRLLYSSPVVKSNYATQRLGLRHRAKSTRFRPQLIKVN